MARFGTLGTQYFDSNGNPLSAGKVYIYETGTTTDKTSYSDSAMTTANTQPVVLDSAGRQPDIFFAGQANAVLKTSADVQVTAADPVGDATTDSGISDWSASATYDIEDLVKASDGKYYISITNSNTNNDPTTSPTLWAGITMTVKYNTSYTFDTDDMCESSGVLYISLTSSNLNNTPISSPTNWKPLNASLWTDATPKTTAFTAVAGRRYLIDTATTAAFTMTLPLTPTVGDIVGFQDYAENFNTDNLTVGRNGEDIMNLAEDLVCGIQYFSGELQYTGATRGWVLI